MNEALQQEEERVNGKEKPKPFPWSIMSGADSWTDNSAIIGNLSDPPIVEGLLREGEVASVVGGAKSCKTWFSLALGIAVATGDPFLGFMVHHRRVL